MKAPLLFDPDDHDYGPASVSIRTVLSEWAEIDWFETSELDDDHGCQLFREHNTLAHARAPALFASTVDARVECGGWAELSALCTRVRNQPSWDWKFNALKPLSREHAAAHGWSLAAHAKPLTPGAPRPGDLFFRFDRENSNPLAIWHNLSPRLDALQALDARANDSAQFYLGHTHLDLVACIEWQLATAHDNLADNPFLPLLLCYGAGFYPFSLDRETVVLFRFDASDGALPTVTLESPRA